MAAYAALVSLMNTMEQIQNHPCHSNYLHQKQSLSLREKVEFLLDFMECYSHVRSKEAEVLESQIAYAAHAAEDVIESHVVDQIEAGSISLFDLQNIIDDMDSIKQKVVNAKDEKGIKDLNPTYQSPATPSKPLTTENNIMVGLDDELVQLVDRLIGPQANRQTISIVGMGGIGKTTLARNIYEKSVIMQHFDIRAWVTISQEYSTREILLQLLSCQRDNFVAFPNESDQRTEDHLGVQLHKSLSGRRYLIILDDLWSIEVWDKIMLFLPDNGNRSRIVVTTRLSNLAIHFGNSLCHAMNFLDEDKSWNLFCKKAFAPEGCPPELEKILKKIVKRCNGLPLSIVVIGGLLRNSYMTQEHWENVAKDIISTLNSQEYEHCLNILSLSYSHLPAHLKPCFLYMGTFTKDHDIRVSRLIKLWAAEGFIRANTTQSLEEVAAGYLKDLIDRNLILVRRQVYGKIKTCNMHDLIRDLCLRIGKKEKFLCVLNILDIPQGLEREHRIVIHERVPDTYQPQVFDALQLATLVRSLICKGEKPSVKSRLLRVLHAAMGGRKSLKAIFQQVNLRYLAYLPLWFHHSNLHSSISNLWNVQTLIFRYASLYIIVAPSEIWKIPTLRHLEFDQIYLPGPLSDQPDDFALRNLQTLLKVVNLRLSEEVCKGIPNIKKLHMIYTDFSRKCEASSYYSLNNLGCLHRLESLNCLFKKPPNQGDLVQNLTFPQSLKKLSLTECHLHWDDLTMIGSLPHLEVLKLETDSVTGSEWNPIEGEFLCLKYLKISMCRDLIYWNADSYHFPMLENLVLEYMHLLDEIPSGIGEIPTLRVISLLDCSEFTATSAMRILEEQESFDNEDLQVRVRFREKEQLESFRENVEVQSFTSNNFHLKAI